MSSNLFDTVRNMEEPLAVAADLAIALALIAETIDDNDGRVIQRLAWILRDQIGKAEKRRGVLFRLAHPRREQFETEGWPS